VKTAIFAIGLILATAGFLMALLDDGYNADRWWHSMLTFGVGIVAVILA
jgi:hypothetical protein